MRKTYKSRYRSRNSYSHARRDAWDNAPDRGDFDDMGRDAEANRYHYDQKRKLGRF